MFVTVKDDDDDSLKKLSHRQKQRAARRLKKKTELAEKRKAAKLAKTNVNKKTEESVEAGSDDGDGGVNGGKVQGRFYLFIYYSMLYYTIN